MGIKINVQGIPYYVCSPATADGEKISVPVLPEKYTDWNDTLSKYLLEDQYTDSANTGDVRWESPSCVAYGYSRDGDCGSATSDAAALQPFYVSNLKLQEHPTLGMCPDKIFSFSDTLTDFVFYSDYVKATIDIETGRNIFLDFNRVSSSQLGYHFICGKGKHTVVTKIFPKNILYNTNSSCKIKYGIRNIDTSDSQERVLSINSIPLPQWMLSICDLNESSTAVKYTAWDDTKFADWKDAHWKANTKILSTTSDNKQDKNTWSSKYVVKGIKVGRYTNDSAVIPGFYDDASPLSVSTTGTVTNYISSKMNSDGFLTFTKNVSKVDIGVAKDSTLPVAVGELKGYSGTASPLYSGNHTYINTKSIFYSELPVWTASLDSFTSPWDVTIIADFAALTSINKDAVGYHFSELAINPMVFEYSDYKMRCRNILGSDVTYKITIRLAYNSWSDSPITITKKNEEWIDLLSYTDNNNYIFGEIKVEATVGEKTATCTLMCPLDSQSRTFLFTPSQAVVVKPNISVYFNCDDKKAYMLAQNISTICTSIESTKGVFAGSMIIPGCSKEFTLPYETFTDTIKGYWNKRTSYSRNISPYPTAVNYTTNISDIYNKSGTVQVYWCNVPTTDTTITNTKENRHFMVVNDRSSEVSLILNGGDTISMPAKSQYQSDSITAQQGVKIISTLNDIKYYWEMKTPTSPSTATFTTATNSKPYRFAKLGRFRTVVDCINAYGLVAPKTIALFAFLNNSTSSKLSNILIKVNGVEDTSSTWQTQFSYYPEIPDPYNYFGFYMLSSNLLCNPFSVEFTSTSFSNDGSKNSTPYCIAILDTSKINPSVSWESCALSEFYVMQ